MSYPAVNNKDLKDVIKVIKAVKKLGVTKLKLGTLEFELEQSKSNDPDFRARPALKVSKKSIEQQDEKNQLQLDFNDANDELSIMHVQDPHGFEQALIDKELDDTMSGGEAIEETYDL